MVTKTRLGYVFVLGFTVIVGDVIPESVTNDEKLKVALIGGTSLFKCSLHVAARHIVWSFGGQNISISLRRDGKYTEETDTANQISIMRIRNIRFSDSGEYSCKQYFQFLRPRENVFTLKVQEPPRLNFQRNVSFENDTINASCCVGIAKTADGISIFWFMDSGPFYIRNNTTILKQNKQDYIDFCSRVSFYSTRKLDGLVLTCLVQNELNLSTSVMLQVMYRPSVRMLMTSYLIVINEETDFKVICEADGNPLPVIKLQKKVRGSWSPLKMKPTLISMTGYNSSWLFYFDNVNNSVVGQYRCSAVNRYGEAFSTEAVDIVEIISKGNATVYTIIAIVMVGTLVFALIVKEKHHQIQQCSASSSNSSKGSDEKPDYLAIYDLPGKAEENTILHAYDSPPEKERISSPHDYEVNFNEVKTSPQYHTLEKVSRETKL
ncbi:Cell adhesion molecule 3 [Holothuria leucospilota]|uniref:Cell adhesion molecule 3 n=1 Tax=Holothuria leucospilota TaxID=206669 RepID=A0A9Q1BZA0_HOLLE|nr:Cell adhesion molecule 3 [Holothuria leucospilota]